MEFLFECSVARRSVFFGSERFAVRKILMFSKENLCDADEVVDFNEFLVTTALTMTMIMDFC